MDAILGKVTQQAMNYAIRSGVTLTASYAIKQSGKLLQSAPKSNVRDELLELQQRLQHKIKIVSPAIDLIELIAARGNTTLESAAALTKELRLDIQRLGQRLAKAAASSEEYNTGSARNKAALRIENEKDMEVIVWDMRKFLARIEDAVPLINLALNTSGAKLSTNLPSTVSPSRLLQASTFLTTGDTQYTKSPSHIAPIGPTFTLSVYMLFAGYDRPETEEDVRNTTWKEVIHKARVKLRRVPLDVVTSTGSGSDAVPSDLILSSRSVPDQDDTPSQVRAEARADEFAYQLTIVEDLNDDRVHDFEDEEIKPGPFDDVRLAGVREMIPVHEISKIFYADTSKVLNIGMDAESNHPVLLLRRDVQAAPPRRMMKEEDLIRPEDVHQDLTGSEADDGRPKTEEDKQHVENDHADRRQDPWRLPSSLDPEWIAFEVYTEAEASDNESDQLDGDDQDFQTPNEGNGPSGLSLSMSGLHINSPSRNTTPQATPTWSAQQQQGAWTPQIKTSLSLLELLLRLTSLQQFQQQSHLSITDELLNFFLEESASTGAGGNEQHRQAIRADARRRVGWDPYDESPVKRRGEDYQYHATQSQYSPSQHYGSPNIPPNAGFQYPYHDSVTSPSQQGSPLPGQGLNTQTRSITGTPESNRNNNVLSPTSGNVYRKSITIENRPDWLRNKQGSSTSRGSPLRPTTSDSDEDIGTSPGSALDHAQQ